MNYRHKLVLIIISMIFVTYAVIGGLLHKVTAEEGSYSQLSIFNEVLSKIRSSYVEDPNLALVMNGALRGLLESLDPYSTYLTPEEYAHFKKHKSNGSAGVGLELSKEPQLGLIFVIHPIADGPADKAGIRAGDFIESIEDVSTRDISIFQAEYMMGGEPGSSIKFKIVRRSRTEPFEVSVKRELVKSPAVKATLLEGKIGYLHIYRFVAGTAEETRQKLQTLMKGGAQRIILDMRNCGGDEFEEGVKVANLFLDHGIITYYQGQKFPKKVFVADPRQSICKLPLAVLQNAGSTSAAEIVSAAIKENRRGELVGLRSFGKASIQKLIPLEGDSAILISVAKFYSQSGKVIQKDGITPDHEVRNVADAALPDSEVSEEPDDNNHEPAPQSPQPAPQEDLQLQKAIEILSSPAQAQKAA